MKKPTTKLRHSLINHLTFDLAKDMYSATSRDKFNAVVLSVRENLVKRWIHTQQQYYEVDAKRIYYLSLEFLLGRLLRNYVINLDMTDEYKRGVDALGLSYEEIIDYEWDAGLGNGGLGRLAACFLDSMATLQYPGYGYGIRYEYGIFTQRIRDGGQVESPDNWLRYGNLWEFARPELLYPVRFYGRVNTIGEANGRFRMEWADSDDVMAMAYDYPVPGFRNNTVNTLRLWAAKSTRDFDLEYFNSGDYIKAVESKNNSENISKVLYPNDKSLAGKELRLKQQYFFVSATLQDIIRRYKKVHHDYREFPEKVAMQLNDTHPAIAIAELMRILVDEERMPWDESWAITTKIFAYTNHTVLPEALETWPEGLLGNLLPRHVQIIREIDRRFLVQVEEHFGVRPGKAGSVAIVTDDGERHIHMARLAVVGSHTVNGVSRLHSKILQDDVLHEFHLMMPGKLRNVTNGITPRRWLLQANQRLARLITDVIGDGWTRDLEQLRLLEPFADDSGFRKKFRSIKKANKNFLSTYLQRTAQLSFPSDFLLDCQVKRFHEYKRQLLNILHVITLYNRIRDGKVNAAFVPRTVLFAGKAAPAYFICKLIIKLIHNVASAVASDKSVRDLLKIVFVPNYGVTLAQRIIPAAELSEQISTAGYEASGTGNMKFTLNGAMTIGTLDGANVEIREEVGDENFFLFGLRTEEIVQMRPTYQPRLFYEGNTELRQIIDQLSSGFFSPDNPHLFHPIVSRLLDHDWFFVLADYASYVKQQEVVSSAYRDKERWSKMSILNVARSGIFSSDRAIHDYARNIWGAHPVKI